MTLSIQFINAVAMPALRGPRIDMETRVVASDALAVEYGDRGLLFSRPDGRASFVPWTNVREVSGDADVLRRAIGGESSTPAPIVVPPRRGRPPKVAESA